MRIERINARQILDSRGNPTVEVDVYTQKAFGRASVPSGASTGSHEAVELRDKLQHYEGKSVFKAIRNIKLIEKELKGVAVDEQRQIDEAMTKLDGTRNYAKLGANAVLGVSMACARAGASVYRMPLYEYLGALYDNRSMLLPVPFSNLINGGVHAGSNLKFQEFMVAPIKAKSFSEATMIVSETYHALKNVLGRKYGKLATNVGDEGGFAPPIVRPEEALNLLEYALEEAGYKAKAKIAMDSAASEFYDAKRKKYDIYAEKYVSAHELVDYYAELIRKYKIISIEDPFHEDDYDAFTELNTLIGRHTQVVGDDLTVTNIRRIEHAMENHMCNALLLKVNQVGTLTEAFEAAHLAQRNSWKVMVSHRSGETEDSFISDLTVGLGCGQIKLGAPARGERTAKYNQLLRIEEELGKKAKYARF